MTEPAVRVSHLSKKFARTLRKAMVYGLADLARTAIIPHRFRSPNFEVRLRDAERASFQSADPRDDGRLRPDEFWAVRDVSFELHRGECLGLIGPNGAGKSTIFKILSGIYGPTTGRVEIRGHLSSLIEVGTGFHPMLSGRENIYISGAVLGMSTREIERKFEQIVEFSGVGDFIDMPVKFYSSGMHVRLGFAVLAHLEPDILLIDEILAVGDMEFQKKCIDRINEMRQSNMAIALVSHSLYRIESLCHRAIWLDHGRIVMEGRARDVVRAYREHCIRSQASVDTSNVSDILISSPFFDIQKLELVHLDGRVGNPFAYDESFILRLYFTAKQRIARPSFNIPFYFGGVRIFELSMLIDGHVPDYLEGPGMIECLVRHPRLLPKVYDIELYVRSPEGVVDLVEMQKIGELVVSSDGIEKIPHDGPYAIGLIMDGGVTFLDYEWNLEHARNPHAVKSTSCPG